VSIDQQGFSYVSTLVRTNSGLVLESGKEYLVEARLRPLAESAGLRSVQLFVERLRTTPPGADHWRVVEAMTTNETSFFRDLHPFESLRTTILPQLIEARRS
jgi:chemotaxis protein methyltransferase CheR